MAKAKKVDFKEIGLDIGLILAKQLFKTEYLHYGYWPEGLEVDATKVAEAQENYVELIVSHIPKNTRTILDVGCGAGKFAKRLLDLGYEVDCVSPSPNLTKHVKRLVGDRSRIFACRYEDLETDRRYDLILFSESFQYIPLEHSLRQNLRFVKSGGYILICDFFRKEVEGTSPIGGGHDKRKFDTLYSKPPLEPVKDIDITKETAPSIDVVNDFLSNVLRPIYRLLFYALDNNYPIISRFIKWKFKKKLEKIDYKYLQQRTNAGSFAFFKSYRLVVYRKQ